MHPQKKVETIRKEKRNKTIAVWRRKVMVFLFWVAFFAVLISLSSRLNYFKMSKIIVSGNETVLENEISETTNVIIKNKSSFLLQKDSLLFFPKKAIIKQLFMSYPRLKTIEISKNYPNIINFTVIEHDSDVVWCKDYESTCFFVDHEGIVLDKSPAFSGDAYFRIYDSLFLGETGSSFLDYNSLQNIEKFRKILFEQVGFKIHSINIRDEETFAFRIFAPSRTLVDSPELLILKDFDSEAIVLNIMTIISDPSFAESYSKHPEKLDYIDLRFGNKVYFKFKD